jgi:hypothetical protein
MPGLPSRESADPQSGRESADVSSREWQYEEGPLAKGNSKCTDSFFCILFFLAWMANFVVFYIAYTYGDAERLFFATDYEGNTCGQVDKKDTPLGFYPRLPEDALAAMQTANNCVENAQTGDVGSCSVTLYTVCVAKCPTAGQIVCDYDQQGDSEDSKVLSATLRNGCWKSPIATDEIFHRCVPAFDQYSVTTDYECDSLPIATDRKDYCLGLLTQVTTTEFNTTAGSEQLMQNLVSTSYTISQWLGDIFTALPEIMIFGLGLSIFVAYFYVFIMQYIAGCIIWCIICAIFLLWTVITTLLMFKGGQFFGVEISVPTALVNHTAGLMQGMPGDTVAGQVGATLAESTGVSQTVWMYAAHAAFFFTVFYFFFICAISERIGLTIEVIKVASNTIRSTSLLFVVPFIEWLSLVGLLLYFFAGGALIWTTEFSKADLQTAIDATTLDCGDGLSKLDCAKV